MIKNTRLHAVIIINNIEYNRRILISHEPSDKRRTSLVFLQSLLAVPPQGYVSGPCMSPGNSPENIGFGIWLVYLCTSSWNDPNRED